MKADFSPSLPRRPKVKMGTLWIILVSLLLHIIIFVLIARTPNEIPNFETSQDSAPKIKPITARLIFPTISVPPEPAPVNKPVPEPSPEPETVPEPKDSAQLEEPAVVEQPPPAVVTPEPESRPKPEPKPLTEIAPESAPEPDPAPEVVQPETKNEANFMQQDPMALPQSSTRPELAEGQEQTVADKVKDQLHSSTQQSIADLAAEEAARYRREQTSPSLFDKPELSQLTEDEKLEKENEVLADCSSYTNKGVAVLAGLMGGNVKCTTTNGAESFIHDRLNKTAHLPAMKEKKDR